MTTTTTNACCHHHRDRGRGGGDGHDLDDRRNRLYQLNLVGRKKKKREDPG